MLLFGLAGVSGFFLDNLYLILVGRVLLGVAVAGTMTGFIALIGDLYQGKDLDKFMGFQASVMSFGGVIYLSMSGMLADISWNYPFLIYLMAFGGLIFFQMFVQDNHSTEMADKTSENLKSTKFRIEKKLAMLLMLAFVAMALYLMIPIQLPFFMNSLQKVSNSLIGIYMSLWIFFSASASLYYKKLRTKLSYSKIFGLGLLLWAVGYFIMYLSNNIVMIMPGLILAGIGNGLVFPNIKVLLLNITFPAFRGRAAGLLTMSLYLGQFFSPIIMQPIIKFHSIGFIFGIFGGVLLLLSLIFFRKRD
jgi:MFS family permease